ncbi:uncharacterized protein KGF55_002989 [Candida pseudojiufengensis]|uniref:uncharacterized protein n=1 Tax=Candida pseudojiufengensis TaxID=497109 RepID=UPI002223EF68|nr:uncharacterized protein KGF55_002989 [Candida pseudojiufengensis]KAI5963197.1 hypothetical protein KGF55_002989 [Candida pseudojiufengensis]
MISLYLILSFILSIVLSAPTFPTPPSEDDFYIPPQGFENAKSGDILKYRNTPNKLRSIYFPLNVANSWQLLVRSEDSFGNPNAFVTTIMEPYNADPNKVVSYQTYEDSAHIDCSPSYGFLYGASMSTLGSQTDMTLMVLALNRGYYVVSPDYEGPKSAFTAGRQSGYATLNSIRATLNSKNITGINTNAKLAMWGYSGGSLASGWATALLPTYAPELERSVIGTALGGFFSNVTALLDHSDAGLVSGLIPNTLNGLSNEYPNITQILRDNSDPNQADLLKAAKDQCVVLSALRNLGENYFTGKDPYFPNGYDVLKVPEVNAVLQENNLVELDATKYLPSTPIFIYHGTLDQVLPIRDSLQTYKQWCDAGVNSVEFAEDLLNGHLTEYIIGAPAAWTWLEKRFDGVPPVQGCSHTTRLENLLYPNISQATSDYFDGLVDAVSFAKIGYQGLASDNVSTSSFGSLLSGLGTLLAG